MNEYWLSYFLVGEGGPSARKGKTKVKTNVSARAKRSAKCKRAERALSPVAECALGRAFHPVGLTEFETSFPLKRWASKTRDLFSIMSAQSKLRARRKDAVRSMLRARQKDGKRIGFLRTGDKALREMLRPVTCAILSLPSEYGFALPGMVELLRHRNLYRRTGLKDRFDDLKDMLQRPKQRSLDELRKIKYEEFLEGPLTRIIHLQTYEKDEVLLAAILGAHPAGPTRTSKTT